MPKLSNRAAKQVASLVNTYILAEKYADEHDRQLKTCDPALETWHRYMEANWRDSALTAGTTLENDFNIVLVGFPVIRHNAMRIRDRASRSYDRWVEAGRPRPANYKEAA